MELENRVEKLREIGNGMWMKDRMEEEIELEERYDEE